MCCGRRPIDGRFGFALLLWCTPHTIFEVNSQEACCHIMMITAHDHQRPVWIRASNLTGNLSQSGVPKNKQVTNSLARSICTLPVIGCCVLVGPSLTTNATERASLRNERRYRGHACLPTSRITSVWGKQNFDEHLSDNHFALFCPQNEICFTIGKIRVLHKAKTIEGIAILRGQL